jgi:hypothetical protein
LFRVVLANCVTVAAGSEDALIEIVLKWVALHEDKDKTKALDADGSEFFRNKLQVTAISYILRRSCQSRLCICASRSEFGMTAHTLETLRRALEFGVAGTGRNDRRARA